MAKVLYKGPEGTVIVPRGLFLDRSDGGHLIVNPPREVWECSELTAEELVRWSFLVAAAGRAMIDALPQLEGGCVNYFEAGNWALNDPAPPRGPKKAREHRSMHIHIFGRSRNAEHPSWRWGEAPRLPLYKARKSFSATFSPLDGKECAAVARRLKSLLGARYGELAPGAKSRKKIRRT
jgi:diadenosine tetraphosphate (Ap4A) HIT family hydrolase